VRSEFFRFSPPTFDLPDEAQWPLLAAFSPSALRAPAHLDPSKILEWSHLLALRERIAAIHGSDALASALGPIPAEALMKNQRQTAGRSLLLIELARLIANSAGRLGTPIVLVKGIALLVADITPLGSRGIYDVDALIPRTKAQPLADDLVAQGLARATVHESSQHLPALIHPRMGVTEIHVSLREVHIDSKADACFEDLERQELLSVAPDPENALVPSADLLAAHALAHGIAQHGRSPQGYPFFRMVADLQDLASPGHGLRSVLENARPFISQSVSARELRAVLELEEHLRHGSIPTEGDGAALLRHTIGDYLYPDYRRSLKVGAFWSAVQRRDWTKISRRIKHSLAGGPKVASHREGKGGTVHSALEVLKVGWTWLASKFGVMPSVRRSKNPDQTADTRAPDER